MEPIASPTAEPRAAAPVQAELVIQNGRLKGTRRPLTPPLTLIGRSAGCDVRLNVDGIHPVHCLLVYGPDGLLLRVVPGVSGTLLNGAPAADGPLADGDVLGVGPFQFQVSVRGAFSAQAAAAERAAMEVDRAALRRQLEQEREALRIQAAAVVAQQAALGEDEARLQQRRSALEQQEEQLSTHLEDKRRRLSELREQIKDAHALLRREREAHVTRLAETRQELEVLRREVEDGREQMQTDRQRLRDLRRRLKHRWHRHWVAERATMRQREAELVRRLAELERETALLEEERARLAQDRLVFNGDVEVGRRRLQAGWEQLRQEKQQEAAQLGAQRRELSAQREALDERDTALTDGERELAAEQEHWHHTRRALEKEIEGLENRARNFRRKIHDEEQAVKHLEAVRAELRSPDAQAQTTELKDISEMALSPTILPPALLPAPVEAAERPMVPTAGLQQLERLLSEVTDQRLCLVEQYERLVQAQQHWQHQHEVAAAELEAVGRRLEEREQGIERRERALSGIEQRLRDQQRDALHLQRYLDGWQSRMTARESAWRGERDRLLADVQGREELAEKRLKAVALVQQRWTRRRRLEVEWLRSERTICEKLRREWAGLRDEWVRRSAEFEKEQRELEERTLALEQHQQECLGQSPDAAAAGRRLEKLRRRWEGLSIKTAKDIARQRATLTGEVAELKEERKRLQKQSAHLSALEEELSQRQTQWEQKELLIEDELSRLRNDVAGTHAQRDRYERQVNELRDEVERLARLLLDEAEPVHLPVAQAA